MTTQGDERIHARYHQVLAWRNEGVTYPEIGRRLGVSPQRASDLGRRARRWQQQVLFAPLPTPSYPTLTAETPVQALPISAQAKRALWRAGVGTVGQAAVRSDASLLHLRHVGAGTVATLRAYLAAHYQPAAASCPAGLSA